MPSLTVLSVAHNSLSSLEGIQLCPNLTELNAASNQLTTLGRVLDQLPLRILNLADNLFHSRLTIIACMRVTSLIDVAFEDPLYGSNPVCEQAGYTSFASSYLLHVERLDTRRRADLATASIERVFASRDLFYRSQHQRWKTQVDLLQKHLDQETSGHKDSLLLQLEPLDQSLKLIKHELELRQSTAHAADFHDEEGLRVPKRLLIQAKQTLERGRDQLWQGDAFLDAMRSQIRTDLVQMRDSVSEAIQAEMDTAGTISMDVGLPFCSCGSTLLKELTHSDATSEELPIEWASLFQQAPTASDEQCTDGFGPWPRSPGTQSVQDVSQQALDMFHRTVTSEVFASWQLHMCLT